MPRAWLAMSSVPDAHQRLAAESERSKEIALRWRSAAQSLAARTGVAAAVETVRHLETETWLGLHAEIPLPGPFLIRGGPEGDYTPSPQEFQRWVIELRDGRELRYQEGLCLVPFVDLDRPLVKITRSLQLLTQSPRVTNYDRGVDVSSGRLVRAIFLPELSEVRPLSEVGRGISLLYQAGYAMRRIAPDEPSRQSELYWRHEVELTRLHADLMAAVAPEAYRTVLRSYLDALHDAGDLLAHPRRLMDRTMKRALRQIFGHIDRDELHIWGTHAYRDAIRIYLGEDQFVEYLRQGNAR